MYTRAKIGRGERERKRRESSHLVNRKSRRVEQRCSRRIDPSASPRRQPPLYWPAQEGTNRDASTYRYRYRPREKCLCASDRRTDREWCPSTAGSAAGIWCCDARSTWTRRSPDRPLPAVCDPRCKPKKRKRIESLFDPANISTFFDRTSLRHAC